MSQRGFIIKVAFGGEAATGKTSIIGKLRNPDFDVQMSAVTVGLETESIEIRVNEGTPDEKRGTAELVDVPGSESYKMSRISHYRNSDFVVLVFALNSRRSFEALTKWYDTVKDMAPPDARYVVVGNKCDLQDQRDVSEADGEETAKKFSADPAYFEVSALTGLGIDDLRNHIVEETHVILRNRGTTPTNFPKVVELGDTPQTKAPKNDDCC